MPFKDFTTEILTSADVDLYLMSQVTIRCTSSTRPSSPAQGWHIYETDTRRFMVYNGSSWVAQALPQLYALKPSDESVSSSTTLQDDDDLLASVEANTNYIFECFLPWTGGNGIKIGWTFPSGTTGTWTPHNGRTWSGTEALSLDLPALSLSTSVDFFEGNFSSVVAMPQGLIRVGGTAGTFRLQWAQLASGGSTTVKANAYLRLTALI